MYHTQLVLVFIIHYVYDTHIVFFCRKIKRSRTEYKWGSLLQAIS